MNMTAAIEALTGKALAESTDQEIYLALLDIVREQSAERVRPVTGRKLSLHQRRVPDRQAAVQQPDQLRAVR